MGRCVYFKQGKCEKGDKCKFSHDLAIERKTAKKDIYTDAREENREEGMENWDDEKLKDVVGRKHGDQKLPNQTDIICKYFLDAIENRKYGWFWECPNGGILFADFLSKLKGTNVYTDMRCHQGTY